MSHLNLADDNIIRIENDIIPSLVYDYFKELQNDNFSLV